ncbi:chaperonin Cpn60/TCP-1 family [Kockiozyma suomiensis]|uniref:chaperonin Cpn60/TCP-1 family n=1 Tax=Kockiozyma suomiensis TaxID=1337062 RepID=UPI003342ED5B
MSGLSLPSAPGTQLFKPGYQTYQSEDGAISRNIDACREIASIVRTSIGPCGRNKIVINHLQKVFLTSDAATILRELEVIHPAAKLMVMASQQQESEMGDATNLVIIMAGELLNQAENLIRIGLHPADIIQGYELAEKFAQSALEELVVDSVGDLHVQNELFKAIRPAIMSKQYGSEDVLANLVAEAVLSVMPKNPKNFNVDNVRVVKIMGSNLTASTVVKGMVFNREPEGSVKNIASTARVGVFTCPIDISQTETKGTVLLHNAKEMLNFTKDEEAHLEADIKAIADSGIRVLIAGAAIGELALNYLNRYGILVLRVPSKFDLRRLCRVVGATPLPRFGAPMPEEMGKIDIVETIEIGGDRVTVVRQENEITRTSTIVIRGATQGLLDDVERAIDDGVSIIKSLAKDGRLLPGAGATEIELVQRIGSYGEKTPGVLQHAIKKYGEAFEIVPRILADNAGLDATEILGRLYAAHGKKEDWYAGVDVDESDVSGLLDTKSMGIYDALAAKSWAIKLATDTVNTILSVDQIVMAKRAGGPVMPKTQMPGNWDADDD